MTDIIRVLRIIEYTGPRKEVELHLDGITNGTKRWGAKPRQITMKSVIVDQYPEIIESQEEPKEDEEIPF